MKRHHKMPFGAQYLDDGTARFRLWAPAARQVELSLGPPEGLRHIPLQPREDGWFELITDAAGPGTRYSFHINGEQNVPDPASRFQPHDVHGPSEVIDPHSFDWQDEKWFGRPWEETVVYELHVGTFSPSGSFQGIREKLDYLVDLGVTAIELMPVADFPGKRNWGYDGVLPFAPDSSYGRPEDLKQLVQSAHSRGLMVLLDVVYNHFGPEGNYLNSYAPQFFTDRHHTPWGNGINFDGPGSRAVRDFFINNALYWLTEYHFDGLRFDAVNAILDDSKPDILTELAQTLRDSIEPNRHIHLVLENDRNQSHYLQRTNVRTGASGSTTERNSAAISPGDGRCRPRLYTAQWNDDIHHTLHVLTTGERDGYYEDYADHPLDQLGRCLTEGFAYQGETSRYRKGEKRGEPSKNLPPTAFLSFLQNHDQVGNRAFGDRITKIADPRAVRAAAAILLLAPSPPLLFMGEEFAASTPFLFFCDFEKDLAAAVTEGRRNEFAQFAMFSNPAERERIPDPGALSTFQTSHLNWSDLDHPEHREWQRFYRELLRLRAKYIAPRLASSCRLKAEYAIHGKNGLTAHWDFPDNSTLRLVANLGPVPISNIPASNSTVIFATEYATEDSGIEDRSHGTLPPWSVQWSQQ